MGVIADFKETLENIERTSTLSAAVARLYQGDVAGMASTVVIGVTTLPFRAGIFVAKKIAKGLLPSRRSDTRSNQDVDNTSEQSAANTQEEKQKEASPQPATEQNLAADLKKQPKEVDKEKNPNYISKEVAHYPENKNTPLSQDQKELKEQAIVIGNRVHKKQTDTNKVNTSPKGKSKVAAKEPSIKGI